MDAWERYADMIGIRVNTTTVTVKPATRRGRKKKKTDEEIKSDVIAAVNADGEPKTLSDGEAWIPPLAGVEAERDFTIFGESENADFAALTDGEAKNESAAIADETDLRAAPLFGEEENATQAEEGTDEILDGGNDENITEKEIGAVRRFIQGLLKRNKEKRAKKAAATEEKERTVDAESGENPLAEALLDDNGEGEKLVAEGDEISGEANGAMAEGEKSEDAPEAEEAALTTSVKTVKKRRVKRVFASGAAAALVVGAIFGVAALSDTLNLSAFFTGVFSSPKTESKRYVDYDAAFPALAASSVTLDQGVMTVSQKGAVYAALGGTVKSVTEENGKIAMEISHGNDLATKITGLDFAYAAEGETVYGNIPVGYSKGEGYTVCFYSGSGMITDYEFSGGTIVWKAQDA